jgi:hypothetical protein
LSIAALPFRDLGTARLKTKTRVLGEPRAACEQMPMRQAALVNEDYDGCLNQIGEFNHGGGT